MPPLRVPVMIDQAHYIFIWAALAFCLWLALSWLISRLRVPKPVLVAATLSWIVAWLFIWAVPIVLHDISSWPVSRERSGDHR